MQMKMQLSQATDTVANDGLSTSCVAREVRTT
jgi:hypothetical protein